MLPDFNRVPQLLSDVAERKILPRFRALATHEVTQKTGGETVTIADTEAELRLEALLRDLAPGTDVIGEEKAATDKGLLARLPQAEALWVIDPIDGTNNFARGSEVFRTMLAFVYQGETVAGWIYDPVKNKLLEASKGEGARYDGISLKIDRHARLSDCSGTLHGSLSADPALTKAVARNRSKVNAEKTQRCAGADYERLCRGQARFSLYSRLMPWDHLPGVLIHREAGGYSACLNGRPYNLAAYDERGLLLAPNHQVWQELYEVLEL